MSPTDILPIIRTSNGSDQVRVLWERLSEYATVPPVIVYDARFERPDFGADRAIPLTPQHLESLGFHWLPNKWAWLCGDFCYYLTAAQFPDHQYYLLIEDDAYLSSLACKALFHKLDSLQVDGVASQLAINKPDIPRYSAQLDRIGLQANVGCIFPLTIASNRLTVAMKRLRTKALDARIKVNDEAIFAATLCHHDLPYMSLEDLLPGQVTPDNFDTNPPHLYESLDALQKDERIWHPVVPYAKILERIQTGEKNYTRRRLRNVLNTASGNMHQGIISALKA